MIRASLAAFINASELKSLLGINAFVKTPDTVASEIVPPKALVTYLHEGTQELWLVGDAQRKENPIATVCFYLTRAQDVVDVRARFKRLIESATATDVGSISHPGINYMAVCDLLDDSGDHLTYNSRQPNWFSSPTPIVYKEDANGVPQVVASGYSVNTTNGTVTFGSSQGSSKIRATYKVGLIDFTIIGVNEVPETDVENNPSKYCVVFDLMTFFYIKTNANKYL